MFDLPFLKYVIFLSLHVLVSLKKTLPDFVKFKTKKHFGNIEQYRTKTLPKENYFFGTSILNSTVLPGRVKSKAMGTSGEMKVLIYQEIKKLAYSNEKL